ncbi:hypothetical protein [Streptomyces californicus]|uniref:hypothetical protein n=1 Tax=Streptomyces californicus TaxID=67351 RepID=UPI0036764E84
MAQDLITITIPAAGKPDCPDWEGGRKVTVTPRTLTLHYRPGHPDAIRAEVTGPWKPSRPGILYDRPGDMTVFYDEDAPGQWPTWIRDLAAQFRPAAT